MASIIEGFNYDIFISYRQKDNKFDGWVTRFVGDLKKELEATFKEDITIYFDENPYDGLLEMHNVDKSLEGKLKSLIFIPIISQTYCDTKSFAWQNEFCAFNRNAKEDQFGRDIKLSGGNVTSRILPVKINDLEPEDQELVEKELGGVLRSIEFVYKEPGVNRPLTPDDDEKKNLNNTRYRNQINKVANTVKGIIRVMKDPHSKTVTGITDSFKMEKGVRKGKITKTYIAASIIIIFLLAGIFTIPALIKKRSASGESITEKSIAVLPFKNLSNDPEQDYFSDGMMDEILDRLFKIGDMTVISRTSSMRFKNSDLSLKEIAGQLGVTAILEGSVRKAGNTVRITVQLIDAGTDAHLWSETYDGDMSDLSRIFLIQSEVAQSVARELKAVLSPHEIELIEKSPTSNRLAYEYYLQGRYYLERHTQQDYAAALQYFEKAIEEDPEYAPGYAGISSIWLNLAIWGYSESVEAGSKAIAASKKAVELDSTALLAYAGIQKYFKWDWKGAELSYKRYITFYPNDARGRVQYANLLTNLGRFEEAEEQNELATKLDPLNIGIRAMHGYNLFIAGKYNDAIEKWNEILKINPGNMIALSNLPVALHLIGKYSEELDAWKTYLGITYNDFISEKEIKDFIDSGYTEGGLRGSLNLLADTLVARLKTHYILPWDIACIYACADNYVRALDMLESCYEMHDLNILWAVTYPVFDKLHNEPRFQEIARKMNLPYR